MTRCAALVLALAGASACTDDGVELGGETGETGETGEDPEAELPWPTFELGALPYEHLSDYGLFVGDALAAFNPAAGVHPYTVVSPLFSDFAGKSRFAYVPEGKQLHIDWNAVDAGPGGEGEMWDWPTGTVLIKTFYFDLDRQAPGQDQNAKLIETRLMVRYDEGGDEDGGEGWEVFTYVWDEAQQDAVLTRFGKNIEVDFTDVDGLPATQQYKVPGLEQCGSCHSRSNVLQTLGPVSQQMNYEVLREGVVVNQMQWLESLGLFDEPLPDLSKFPTMVDPMGEVGTLDQRARSYLHANCAHCHRRNGGAGISGLRYPYWEDVPIHLGICKPPAAAGAASDGRPYDIVPGAPDQSIVVFRMESLDPMIKMPELPSRVLNPEGIELISDWIAAMEPPGCGG